MRGREGGRRQGEGSCQGRPAPAQPDPPTLPPPPHSVVYDIGTPRESFEWYRVRGAPPADCVVGREKVDVMACPPAAAGSSLRIPIPELSEERRVQMVKLVKQLSEEAKVRIRSIRKEGMDTAKKLKADNLLTEDGQKDHESQVQKLTDKFIKVVDEHVVTKEKEVMKV